MRKSFQGGYQAFCFGFRDVFVDKNVLAQTHGHSNQFFFAEMGFSVNLIHTAKQQTYGVTSYIYRGKYHAGTFLLMLFAVLFSL
jgi:hypothetical protein